MSANKEKLLFYTPMSLRYGGGFEEWLKKTVDVLSDHYDIEVMYGSIGLKRYSSAQVNDMFSKAVLSDIRFLKLFSLYFIDLRDLPKFLRAFRSAKYIYFNYAFVLQELLVYLAYIVTKKRIVVGFHAPTHFSKHRDAVFDTYSSRLLKKHAGFHVLNKETRDELSGKGFKNVHLIANYLLKRDLANVCSSELPKKIVFVGRYERQKGVDLLVLALKKFFHDHPQSKTIFMFYGSGSMKPLIDKLAIKYPDNIHELGYSDDKQAMYKGAAFVVIPSRQDQMSMTLLESLGHGVPVIATMVAGANQIVQDNKNGIVIMSTSPLSIKSAIERAEKVEAAQLRALSKNAIELIERGYTEDNFVSKISSLFESFIRSRVNGN